MFAAMADAIERVATGAPALAVDQFVVRAELSDTDGVVEISEGSAPPEDGRANDALLDLLAKRLDLPRRSLSIVSGHTSREKVVRLEGIGRAESERRLEGALA